MNISGIIQVLAILLRYRKGGFLIAGYYSRRDSCSIRLPVQLNEGHLKITESFKLSTHEDLEWEQFVQ